MIKKFFVIIVALGALVVPMAGGAAASNGKGNGAVGCTLSGGEEFKNPAAMLKFLAERDGSFQNTVDLYPNHFSSVGDLINQKCGA